MKRNVFTILMMSVFLAFTYKATGQTQTLSTHPTLVANNGLVTGGVSFEIEASSPILITGFEQTFSVSTSTVNVWYRTGGVQSTLGQTPNITAANGWVLHETNITVSPVTATDPVGFTMTNPFPVIPGTPVGIFLENGPRYVTWNANNQDVFTDGTLTIKNGTNFGYGGTIPTPTNHPRQFAGAVDYTNLITPCGIPLNFNTVNITANTAEATWDHGTGNGSYTLEYGPQGFAQGTGTLINGTISGVSAIEQITGLSSITTYQYFITETCNGGNDSFTIGPFLFTTPCATFMAPFFEDFEDGVQPACWDNITNNSPGTSVNTLWRFNSGVSNGAVNNGKAPGTYAWTNGSVPNPDSILLITPDIDISALSSPALGFEWFSNNTNTPGNNNTMTVNLFDGLNWINLDTLSGDSSEWRYEFYDLSAWAGQIIRISFNVDQSIMTSPFHNDILLDDVEINDCTPAPGVDGSEDICRLDAEINLFDYITPGVIGGKWEFPSNSSLIVNDSILAVSTLPSGTFEALYITTGICTSDTTIATINIFPPSSAGQNGTIQACRNQPVVLFGGLSGNVDTGGDWFDPQGNMLQNSQPVTSNIPGNYNYNYIVSNGVCPADTQFVEVIVSATCDYLSVGESELGNIEVYPNPATDVIKIDNNSNAEALVIEVMDMNGRLVLSDANALFNNNHATISIESLETGVYTLRLSNKEGQRTFKVVKQ